jgi:hypothetical protein
MAPSGGGKREKKAVHIQPVEEHSTNGTGLTGYSQIDMASRKPCCRSGYNYQVVIPRLNTREEQEPCPKPRGSKAAFHLPSRERRMYRTRPVQFEQYTNDQD